MSIQFLCTSCGQPIEVDDEHAGKTAACPYCRQLAGVPMQSTYAPDQPPASPSTPDSDEHGPVPPPPVPAAPYPLPSGDPGRGRSPLERQQYARTFAVRALICTAVVLALFAADALIVMSAMMSYAAKHPNMTSAETQAFLQEFQKHSLFGVFQGLQYGYQFFAIAGTALAVVSLIQWRPGNWRGWVALAVCGLFALCTCCGYGLQIAFLSAGMPAT